MRTLLIAALLFSGAARADSLATPEKMDPSCKGHEQNREIYLKELEFVVNGGRTEMIAHLWRPSLQGKGFGIFNIVVLGLDPRTQGCSRGPRQKRRSCCIYYDPEPWTLASSARVTAQE